MNNKVIDITENLEEVKMPKFDVKIEDVEKEENNVSRETLENDFSKMKYNELRKYAKEHNIEFESHATKEELLKLIEANKDGADTNAGSNQDVKVNVEKPSPITLDNKLMNPVVISQEKEDIPKGFISIKSNPKKKTIGSKNGRMYKVINEFYGVWLDNGEAFELKK